jgi:malonyl-CoA O-methyltransferase
MNAETQKHRGNMQTELLKQPINKELLQKRFRCATKTYDKHAIVQKHMAKTLVDMSKNHIPHSHNNIMEIGCGTGLLTDQIIRRYTTRNYVANDLVGEVEYNIKHIIETHTSARFSFLQGDAEQVVPDIKQDVIWSGATIQWIEDLDSFFSKVSRYLNDDGYFALSSFNVDNYREVKMITGKGINYKSMQDVVICANKYFKVLDSQSWYQKLWFKTPADVIKHMRYTGVNGVSATKWNKKDLEQFVTNYEMFSKENSYPLTYHPFLLILQKL